MSHVLVRWSGKKTPRLGLYGDFVIGFPHEVQDPIGQQDQQYRINHSEQKRGTTVNGNFHGREAI